MRYKAIFWPLMAAVVAVCGLSIWGVAWYRARNLTTAALLKRLPVKDALVLSVDFSRLRSSGILQLLAGSKFGEEPDYQAFVRKTEFDYRQDLDTALVSFAPTGRYLLLKGRFDWRSLRTYAENQDGQCYNSVCRMPGSTPERRISYFPLQQNLMAMAVSTDDAAVLRLQSTLAGPQPDIPDAPVWLLIPASVLRSRDDLPSGTRMFARSMEGAETVTLALLPEGNRLAVKLNVSCRNAQDAAGIAAQLSHATALVREAIEREHQTPSPADLSGVLTSGAFRSEGRRVFGYWPIERALVENLLGGR